jgi:hypothetical protein
MFRVASRVLITAALGAGSGCSHEQPPPKHATTPAAAPSIATAGPPEVIPQPPPAPREAPEVKEDDAILFDFDSALVRADPVVR